MRANRVAALTHAHNIRSQEFVMLLTIMVKVFVKSFLFQGISGLCIKTFCRHYQSPEANLYFSHVPTVTTTVLPYSFSCGLWKNCPNNCLDALPRQRMWHEACFLNDCHHYRVKFEKLRILINAHLRLNNSLTPVSQEYKFCWTCSKNWSEDCTRGPLLGPFQLQINARWGGSPSNICNSRMVYVSMNPNNQQYLEAVVARRSLIL